MSEFVRICGKADLPPVGGVREIAAGPRALCIANVNGVVRALDNECPHRGGPLGEGLLEQGQVICPWHAWAFDAKTGVSAHSPNAKVEVYEIEVRGEDVMAKL